MPDHTNLPTNAPDIPGAATGGIRWRPYYPRYVPIVRTRDGYAVRDPDRPVPAKDFVYETEGTLGPCMVTTPPSEDGKVGEEYVYAARAFDANVSNFIWCLKKAPPGMTVDRYSGKVTWTPEDGGHFEVELLATNVYGRSACQSWSMVVRKPPPKRIPVPNRRFERALAVRRELVIAKRLRPVRFVWTYVRRRRAVLTPRTAAPPGIMVPASALPLRL
jgi:hypothetical protein